tara:strand:- start:9471 stop:10097 length:627 start_codon:yes stop_codon:yes gene_type:complete
LSSLYKNAKSYYLSVNLDGKRKVRSLNTKDEFVAKAIRSQVELEMQREIRGLNNKWPKSLTKDLPSDLYVKNSLVNGKVGELYVDADLLKRGFSPSEAKLDDSGVDRIVEIRDSKNRSRFITLQIKYSSRYNSENSIMFDVKKSRADWVAFVTEIQHPNGLITPIVMYMKNKRINKRWTINIQVKDLENNRQNKLVHKWTDFINPRFY